MNFTEALAASLAIGLASAAAWRVIAVDVVTKPLRVWFFNETRDDANGKLYGWLKKWYKCSWCAGAWITALLTLLTDKLVDGGLPAPVLVFGAARYVTGWIGSKDQDYQDQTMAGEP